MPEQTLEIKIHYSHGVRTVDETEIIVLDYEKLKELLRDKLKQEYPRIYIVEVEAKNWKL